MRYLFAVIFCFQGLFGWGKYVHPYINEKTVMHLPSSMQTFIGQQVFLKTHANDADTRKPSDPTEGPKHFLDVDYYPNFKNLTRSLDSLIAKYGVSYAIDSNGILPWATTWAMDSLTAQLKRSDWTKAYQTAADIGHYVGDGHQPLHAAKNYDGKLTGNSGIHSRYESAMLDTNRLKTIVIVKDSVKYISDVYGFTFDYILKSNSLCDSIFHADNAAKVTSGGSYNTTYYTAMWQQLGDMTKAQVQSATIDLASLWYTAWVNAGLLTAPTTVKKTQPFTPNSFNLRQNFPNPFNPETTIQFDVAKRGNVKLSILSVDGKEIISLVDMTLEAGSYSIDWNAKKYSSGVYFYKMETKDFSQTKKLVYLK